MPSAGVAAAFDFEADAETVEELLEKGSLLGGTSSTHIALRGVPVVDSVRCEWIGFARTLAEREKQVRVTLGLNSAAGLPTPAQIEASFAPVIESLAEIAREEVKAKLNLTARGGYTTDVLSLYCFVDYQVSEYLLGSGPNRVTLAYNHLYTEPGWAVIKRNIGAGLYGENFTATRAEYEERRLQPRLDKAETSMSALLSGRDNVMFVFPGGAIGNVAIETWTVVAQWDLQSDNGTLQAVRYGVDEDDQEQTQTLANLKSRVAAATSTDDMAGERVPTISGLTQHYKDIGAYDDITRDEEDIKFTPFNPPPMRVCDDSTAATELALSQDCSILLAVKDTLAGSTTSLNWSKDLAISNWTGVTTGGSPERVSSLNLSSNNLNGNMPSDLGQLQGLNTLDLSRNQLTGHLPGQLANLPALATLKLSGNSFNGCIPGGLREVATHDLAGVGLDYCDMLTPPPAP